MSTTSNFDSDFSTDDADEIGLVPIPRSMDGPWDKLRERVKPLLGDLSEHLGADWHIALDQIFSEVDLEIATALSAKAVPQRTWFTIERFYVDGLAEHSPDLECTDTYERAVAHALQACRDKTLLPTSVVAPRPDFGLDVVVGTENAVAVRVRPMVMRTVGEALRVRAEGTMLGVRKFDKPDAELTKRFGRWPGLPPLMTSRDDRKVADEAYPAAEKLHHPVAKEWMLSVRALCARCGHPDADRPMLEAVAAAAFNVPSWHHLAAPKTGSPAALAGPWTVNLSDPVAETNTTLGCYADAFDAVADMLSRAPGEFMQGWVGAKVSTGGSGRSFDVPSYHLQRVLPGVPDSRIYREAQSIEVTAINAYTDEDDFDAALLAEVSAVIKTGKDTGDWNGLSKLFGIGKPVSDRVADHETRERETLIATSGPWRFTFREAPEGCGRELDFLVARRYDADGNCLEDHRAAAYKAQLYEWNGHHLICGEYQGARPLALIDGLSPEAFDRIAAVLPDQPQPEVACDPNFEPKMSFFGDERLFKVLVDKFMARVHADTTVEDVLDRAQRPSA